ncbi:uncharacterized protein CEXT_432301 [Caerostris extrusa]|uniref:Uncharacterized protein n=1 Tax=Caerostris extrusa TaxID=172846 RepID=A0AAV4RZ26_CAEEX|nr:uncharacterized protein CEXT_432301 [Caerostris extrusa]
MFENLQDTCLLQNGLLSAATFIKSQKVNLMVLLLHKLLNIFETIIHTFHTMDWKFYVKLNYHSKWSEYFIECCQQLEPDILSSILQKILTINWSDEEILKYYSGIWFCRKLSFKVFHD